MEVDALFGSSYAHRPVDWRYRAARKLVDGGQYVSPRDHDEATVAYARYLHRSETCRTGADRRRLAAQYPDLHSAVQIHHDPRGSKRYHLEARLLTGSPASSIAAVIGITPGAVRWYERIFFDVWDRLDDQDFVIDVIFGRGDHGKARDWRDTTWKTAGYFGGVDVLDEVVCLKRGQGLDRLSRGLHQEQAIVLQYVVAQRVRGLESVDFRSARDLIKLAIERYRQSRDEDTECEQLKGSIQAMLTSLPFCSIGRADLKNLDDHDTCAAELRTDELIALSWGIRLSNEADIKSLAFPPVISADAKVPSATTDDPNAAPVEE